MTTPNIDTNQTTKFNYFAKIWPIFLSGSVLLISGAFCLSNVDLFPGINRDFAVLAAHSRLRVFLRTLPDGTILIGVITWIVTGIILAAIARTLVSKVTLIFSFVVAIPLMFVGFLFGLLVNFSPVDSLVLSSNSFNLGYFDDTSGTGIFYFYDCDPQGMNCKKLLQLRSPYEPQSVTGLQFDDSNNQVEILIDGEVVYTHPVE
jgi:hypothetical protein